MKSEFIKDVHYYLEEGRVIFTALYHIQRGECCGNKCRHCPYDPLYARGNNSLQKHFLENPNNQLTFKEYGKQ